MHLSTCLCGLHAPSAPIEAVAPFPLFWHLRFLIWQVVERSYEVIVLDGRGEVTVRTEHAARPSQFWLAVRHGGSLPRVTLTHDRTVPFETAPIPAEPAK